VGNRLSAFHSSGWTYNSSNELTSRPSFTYTYDNDGNTLTSVTGSNTTNYAWDFENRLSSVTLPGSGGTVAFKYDPFGRRIYKSSSSSTSIFAYDGDNLIEETNSSGAAVARYSQTQNIDEPLAMLRGGATSFYDADGLSSVTSLTNSSGSVANTYTYDSFGNLTASSGTLTNPFRYTARESDTETGLYYYRARYYDSALGRFLREDPAGFTAGVNFYGYVGSDPINGRDSLGLWDTYTHSALYWLALKACGVNNKSIYAIQQASALLDAATLAPWQAYIHSMKAPWQSAEDALQERDHWIESNLRAAQVRFSSGNPPVSGVNWEDLFANSVHTSTDSTSPAHMRDGVPISWPLPSNAGKHGDLSNSIETWANMTPELMEQNIQAIQRAYEQVTGKKCGCQ
jgi:RHS repeat-associated protein